MSQQGVPAGPTILDRVWSAFRELLHGELARMPYLGPWEYRVAVVRAGTPVLLDVQSTTAEMPDLIKVPLRRSHFGGYSLPKVGASIVVQFLNGDPTKPYADSLDPGQDVDTAQVTAGTKIKIGGGTLKAAARKTDSVNCGYLVFAAASGTGLDSYYPGTTAGKAAADARVVAMGGPPAYRFDLNSGGAADAATGGQITTGSSKVEEE